MIAHYPQAPYFLWHEWNKAVVPRYHLDTAEINGQLGKLRINGADGISLSIWLMPNAAALGNSDTFTEWNNGVLTTQMQANLTNLLAQIKQHGFNFIQIAPQFYGVNDFRTWTSWQEPLYDQNWIFIGTLQQMCVAAGLPYMIDVCAEFNANYKPDYVRRIWTDTTSWFAPNGAPCWNFSMSFTPSSYTDVAAGFLGNFPAILLPHPYTNEAGSMYDVLMDIRNGLLQAGVPARPWMFGETDMATNAQTGSDTARFVQTTGQLIERVCCWPVNESTPMQVQIDQACVPQVVSTTWSGAGF